MREFPIIQRPGKTVTRKVTGWTLLADSGWMGSQLWISKKAARQLSVLKGLGDAAIPVRAQIIKTVTLRILPPPKRRKRTRG